jgi:hypothetical protein
MRIPVFFHFSTTRAKPTVVDGAKYADHEQAATLSGARKAVAIDAQPMMKNALTALVCQPRQPAGSANTPNAKTQESCVP